ncbi:hypothetical protein [Ideonella sp. BN130291]|uniref:hypothetical protein n=1 Tax=Ideonella sp. BN130291 TaxID=3112940 RepID=UPI002E25E476|nr:hypothetical protein [Ideonella sp. BN130291]
MNPEAATATAPAAAAFVPEAPEAASPAAGTDMPAADAAGFMALARALWGDLHGAITERFKLVGLELRLAGLTLVQVVVQAVIVAVLVVTAWLGLVAGVVAGFVSAGLHWGFALALGIVINLGVAAWLVRSMLKMIERIGMPASLRGFNKR